MAIDTSANMALSEPDFPPLAIKGIGSFRRLDNLKRLQVPLPFLLGFQPDESNAKLADILPRNIEVLTITDALYFQLEWDWSDIELLEVIEFWLQDWRSATPHLKTFHLFLWHTDSTEWGPGRRQQLQDLGAKAGVGIEITKYLCDR